MFELKITKIYQQIFMCLNFQAAITFIISYLSAVSQHIFDEIM